jgi:hypothetical protein
MVGNSPSKKVILGIVVIAVAVVAGASKNSVIEALAYPGKALCKVPIHVERQLLLAITTAFELLAKPITSEVKIKL